MAESRKLVFQQTAMVLIGEAIGTGLMIAVFALLGFYAPGVLWGGLVGAVLATANFFGMAIIATVAADKAEQQDVAGGQKLMKASYPIRLLALAVILIACAKSGIFHVVALVVPLLFARPALTVGEFFKKKGA